MNHQEYNGWYNYETWVVNMWLDNDAGDHAAWLSHAADFLANAQEDATFTKEERAKLDLSDMLKEFHEEHLPEVSGVYSDLLNAAMSEVDWYEIADHFVEDALEQAS